MPHSSGGGSHSGGSSGGSSHSSGGGSHSGGSSGPSYVTKNTYFYGSHRYVRYHNGSAEYIYSSDPRLNETNPLGLLLLLVYVPFIIAVFSMVFGSFQKPKKITEVYSDPIVIEDNIGVLEDSEKLEDTLETFYQKTGIPVTIITGTNDEWIDYYEDMEVYAYDLYVNRYDDEDHWVLVYTTDFGEDFEDWRFHGMQGYNTDSILTEKVTSTFNQQLTKYLMRSSYSVSDGFIQAFNDITPGIMKMHVNVAQLGIAIFVSLFLIFHMSIMLRGILNTKYRKYIKCPDETASVDPADQEAHCEYCDGLYYKGTVTSCPHCGAPIRTLIGGRH